MIELCNESFIKEHTQIREGEKKVGESIIIPDGNLHESLAKFEGQFVLLGVPEDIGPIANYGKGGARNNWIPFTKALLNVQHNQFVPVEEMLLLGTLNVEDLLNTADKLDPNTPEELNRLRELVTIIDERLTRVITTVFESAKTPIVIGGGHNNAYGILAGFQAAQSSEQKQPIGAINIDPHADCRAIEGRHSGNAFSYAFEQDLLTRYYTIGLHENYNSKQTFNWFEKHKSKCGFNLFDNQLRDFSNLKDIALKSKAAMQGTPYGIEIDMDAVTDFPASATTPSGYSLNEVRTLLHYLSNDHIVQYLHIPEAIASSEDTFMQQKVGKTLCYLVIDFIKNQQKLTH